MNILPVFLHPLLYIRRGGVGVQGSTQQTLETLYTETQQLVLDRSELPEELTGVSGSQIGCFFKKKFFFIFLTPVTKRDCCCWRWLDCHCRNSNHPLWELFSVLGAWESLGEFDKGGTDIGGFLPHLEER